MSEQEAQNREDMLMDMYKLHAYIPNDAEGNPLTPFGNFCAGYEAATAEANKRIEALELEVQNWKDFCKKVQKIDFNDYLALQTNNHDLREALDMCSQICIDIADSDQINDDELSGVRMCEEAIDALIRNIKTPAESLAKRDDEVIDRCAKVCDEQATEWDSDSQITHLNYAEHCAMVIRSLKEVK